ncbi:MAG: carboxymuconolactone decarboxylase family protein [Alphaproteobacteria bacterium]|nr:carboxymuconolactone decarboxylase family protein [Alphaproteobacteria bacterium]
MTPRIEYRDVAPEMVGALAGLNSYSDQCCISQNLRRLLEIQVSAINCCSYCFDRHRNQAGGLGESAERIDAMTHWRRSTLFTKAERAAFAWAEAVTEISTQGAPDPLFEELKKHYSDAEIVDLTFVILSMNAWNRLAISFGREADCEIPE